MPVYGERLGRPCSEVPNGQTVCVEYNSRAAANAAGCLMTGGAWGGQSCFVPYETGVDEVDQEFCCPLNVAREVGARGAPATSPIQQVTAPLQQAWSWGVTTVQDLISTPYTPDYIETELAKPPIEQAVYQGMQSAGGQIQQQPLQTQTSGISVLPIVVLGVAGVVILGLGVYALTRR